MAQPSPLNRFKGAMKAVYGPFDGLNDDEAAKWSPPDNPGAGGHRGRYLWTDAFGLVNFLTLYRESASPKYIILADRLIQSVHQVLGRSRDGSARLPGATNETPLTGGLRIGKPSSSGSDGDGQYHHYLTLWMFALNRMSLVARDLKYNNLAIQLAKAIHPRFVLKGASGTLRMVWKISTDMSQVLVPSEGHLDAATGYVVYKLLQQTSAKQGQDDSILEGEIEDYDVLMRRKGGLSASSDFLDLGMGLWMCHLQETEEWASSFEREQLRVARHILCEDGRVLRRDASRRLAFREFGTCLGISCSSADEALRSGSKELIDFWESRLDENSDDDLRPISQVMYAAALIPGVFRKSCTEE